MKLYEITDSLRDLMEILTEPQPAESGDNDALAQWERARDQAAAEFDIRAGDLQQKLRAYAAFALELRVQQEARSAHMDRIVATVLDKMRRQNERDKAKEAWLMSTAQSVIEQFKVPMPLRFSEFTLKLQKQPPHCAISDASALPSEYHRIIPAAVEPDKKKLLADLKEGVVVPGAALSAVTYRLTIK